MRVRKRDSSPKDARNQENLSDAPPAPSDATEEVVTEELDGATSEALPEVTMETALQWLQEIKPSMAMAVLKQPELALFVTRAFLGFRFNAQGYQNPVVRRRLAEEIVREPKLQEVLRAVVESHEEEQTDPLTTGPTDGKSTDNTALISNLKDQLKAEREQRKRDRNDARTALDDLKKVNADLARDIDERSSTLADALAEADSLRDALANAQQKITRLERQNARMKIETGLLAKAAKASQASEPASPKAESKSGMEASIQPRSPFEAAAYRLVSQENLEAALALAEATLTEDPANATALEIATTVYQRTGKRDRAVQTARDLALAALTSSNLKSATDGLLTLLTLDPMSGLINTVSRPYVQALRSADSAQLDELATMFARLGAKNPSVHRRLCRLLDEYVPAPIVRALTQRSAGGPNAALPLQMPQPMTASAVVDAVDSSDEATVRELRTALVQLYKSNPDDYGRAVSAIADAAGGDESYLKPLIGKTTGPAIVDASNAAWYDNSKGIAERPRLRQILLVRAAMRQRGYFPILLIGDAPLPHTIDDRDAFARMTARGEITLSTTGTDADETILREAKRIGATVVSNDYMADWDPDNEVRNLRYVIPAGGPAYLLG